MAKKSTAALPDAIRILLKNTPEQLTVVGPLVQYLTSLGWSLNQMIFGKKEWRIPKSPSEATRREKGRSFAGFPVDIAVFDSDKTCGDPSHILFLFECKQSNNNAGVSQLESYFVGEPHAMLGIWANTANPAAKSVFLYRGSGGRIVLKKTELKHIPRPGDKITPEAHTLTYNDLIAPPESIFRKIIRDLLDKVVANDTVVTRREEQLDQLCNILLTKLESDKQGRNSPDQPVLFREKESIAKTAADIRRDFENLVNIYPETFTTEKDKRLQLADETIAFCVDALSGLRLLDMGVKSVALAFQVLRSEALKQGEGQYFTPQTVIEAGIRMLDIQQSDIIIDPACGTGGFLVQSMLEMQRKFPKMNETNLTRWAQTHIYGIEKDAVGLKLTKAIMQIAGDGSAHCARGDSVRTHTWPEKFPHLISPFVNGRFSIVVTNPPFGKNLKVSAKDSRLSGLTIAQNEDGTYRELEIGLLFLERAYNLVKDGGKIGIVLPETYFFSTNYAFVLDWIKSRLKLEAVANVPMEAFQGFCRAKTNFYIFKKYPKADAEKFNVKFTYPVSFLNPKTCGIYKNGEDRFKINPTTGKRTEEIDNELLDSVVKFLSKKKCACQFDIPADKVFKAKVVVPAYFDKRFNAPIKQTLKKLGVDGITIGELINRKIISVRGGHGSPGNDQRDGEIPYIKVSDIRALRMNVNPTNLAPLSVAERFWKGKESGLAAWDVLTPNRASSNIGEFAMIMPGEERVVLTKEMFVFRVLDEKIWDPFYLFWALCLQPVREEWRRIVLMQTNREDCGDRYREIILPKPPNKKWAINISKPFNEYFNLIANAKAKFVASIKNNNIPMITSATGAITKNTSESDEEPCTE